MAGPAAEAKLASKSDLLHKPSKTSMLSSTLLYSLATFGAYSLFDLYVAGWLTSGGLNPWTATMFDGSTRYESVILGWTLAFAVLELSLARALTGTAFAKRMELASIRDDVGTTNAVGQHFTSGCHTIVSDCSSYVACMIHSTVMSIASIQAILTDDYTNWPHYVAFSLGYWLADTVMWTIPAGDLLLCCHHLLVVAVQYPVGAEAGASLFGGGNSEFTRQMSALCYLTEISTICLCFRWFVLHCWPSDAEELRPNVYRISAIAVLTTWMPVRFLLFPALVLFVYLPRIDTYIESGQLLAFTIGCAAFLGVLLISAHFTNRMLRNGVKSFITLHYQHKLSDKDSDAGSGDEDDGDDVSDTGRTRSRSSSSEGKKELYMSIITSREQAIAVLALVLPQVVLYCLHTNPTVPELLTRWLGSFRNAPSWVQSPDFLFVVGVLGIERACYTFVWTFSKYFLKFCKIWPLSNVGRPVDVVVGMFAINKALQISVPLAWYLKTGSPPRLEDITIYQYVTAATFILCGQYLNASIYRAIGKNGVYYGSRLGETIPWCTGFPFNVVSHPQYFGVMLSMTGGCLLLTTEAHEEKGWLGLLCAQGAWYTYMSIIEAHF